jgi:hypothetical protein
MDIHRARQHVHAAFGNVASSIIYLQGHQNQGLFSDPPPPQGQHFFAACLLLRPAQLQLVGTQTETSALLQPSMAQS